MKYIHIKKVDKTVKKQNNRGNGRTIRMYTAWYSTLLVLSTALLILAGCPETPADQSDTTAPEPIAISNANVAVSSSSISLQWEPSPSDDVAEIQITWTPEDGEDQPKLIDIDSTETTITGLNAGVTYTFSIMAIDTSDNESNAVEISATTHGAVSFAQDSYSFSGIRHTPGSTVGSVSTTVLSPTSADPPITLSYEIIQNNDDDSALFVIDPTTAEITIGATVLDTTRDDYSFTVQATSSQGVMVTTTVAVSPSPLDTTVPDPVTDVDATATAGTTTVTLSWTNSISADAATVRIVWTETVSETGGGTHDITDSTITSFDVTGLTSEVGYTFTLTVLDDAINAAGDPDPNESDAVPIMVTPDNTAPTAVTALTATPLESGTEVELMWTNSSSADATTLDIAWTSSTNDMASGSTSIASGTGMGMHTVSGLIARTPYTFTITVIDTSDNSSPVETAGPINTLANPVDADDDTLIDIGSLEQLHNMRYNLNGTSYKTSSGDGGALCGDDAATTCTGYELTQILTFDHDGGGTYNQTTYALDAGDHDATYFPITSGTGGWLPIGDATTPFSTIFEGNGFYIRGLAVRRNQTYIGMFGRTHSSAIIRNIRLTNNLADYTGSSNSNSYIGGLVAYNEGTISATHAGGPADGGNGGNDRAGGLVGENNRGRIIASYATGVANGGNGNTDYVGGLVGRNNRGNIIASYATGAADGGTAGNTDYVGGLVGWNSGTIIASYATGDVDTGGGDLGEAGGLVGSNDQGTIIASYATGDVDTGGGTVDQAGGLAGFNDFNTSITASYATGNADAGSGGNDYAGSLVGLNAGAITASYGFGSRMGGEVTRSAVESSDDLDPDEVGAGNNPGIAGARLLQAAGGAAGRSVTAAWNQASSNTRNAWDFGTDSQAPALRYADYDGTDGTDGNTYGCGSSSTATIVIPDRVPAPGVTGGVMDVICDTTLLGGPQPR